jgi:cysteinyl-tRNA synthetase
LTLQLYNTLSRTKEPFRPLDPQNVRMYVCGPTVYDLAHVGNARPVVVFDVLYRLLKREYQKVTYVRNITDVDDKIIAAAAENKEPIDALTARTERAFHEDMAALGALPPDVEPHATHHVAQMIAMIGRLIEQGNAYAADGHILFSVATKADYGKLSNRSRDEMIAGARVEIAPYKKDPADFVLWKPSTAEQPGWDSPWGRGRPGWHIECSAMSETHLGRSFDIHGGGLDLIFPHHENEIAQSESAHGGAPFARFWVHNGYVVVEGEKMSKSLGNFFTVRQLLEEGWPGEAIRLLLLTAHYRQPLDFTREGLKQAKAQLDRLYGALRGDALSKLDAPLTSSDRLAVQDALDDDLNTAQALHLLHVEAGAIFKLDGAERLHQKRLLRRNGALLGLLQDDPEAWFKGDVAVRLTGVAATGAVGGLTVKIIDTEQIDEMIRARESARKARNFAEADRIRKELADQGIVLEDKPGGKTEWRRAG